MADDQISIKVNIGERFYPLTIKAGEEEQVRAAARLINDKSKFYQEQFAVKDKQDLLAMAALEFASELALSIEREQREKSQTEQKLNSLIRLMEDSVS